GQGGGWGAASVASRRGPAVHTCTSSCWGCWAAASCGGPGRRRPEENRHRVSTEGFMDHSLLTLMVFTPLLGAAVVLCLPSAAKDAIRWTATAFTIPPVLLSIWF